MTQTTEQTQIDLYNDVSNPLDCIEEIMLNHDWVFDRRNEDELTVQVSGKHGHYKMAFVWQEDFSAMQFCCVPDLSIHKAKMDEAMGVVNRINAGLWLGHFDVKLQQNEQTPCFRHTSLFRGMNESSGVGHIEDLIDIALSECERYYLTFDLLSKTTAQDNKVMDLAMMDIVGQS